VHDDRRVFREIGRRTLLNAAAIAPVRQASAVFAEGFEWFLSNGIIEGELTFLAGIMKGGRSASWCIPSRLLTLDTSRGDAFHSL